MATTRNRRNINCLNDDELHDLREALTALYDLPASAEHSFAKIAGLHGQPGISYCKHGNPGFLTWHRAYMLAFEKALQSINCDIMLPYWDWSSGPNTGLPAACSDPEYVNRAGITRPNPLFSGPRPSPSPGGYTSRRSDVDTRPFDSMATQAQAALGAANFTAFQNALNGPHGSVHGQVGGDMGSVPYAAFDPIFYLHHCNVDRLWAIWQITHGGPLPASEATAALAPFNEAFSTDWKTGADFNSTVDLGYRYQRFCFVLPPFNLPDPLVLKLAPPWRKQLQAARLQVLSDRMEMVSGQLHVFINNPKANYRTPTTGNPNYAGSFGLFGMGDVKRFSDGTVENFDMEMDITGKLLELADEDNEITLKLVAIDLDGKPLKPEQLQFSDIDLFLD